MNVNAGELDERISIIRREITEDAEGYETTKEVVIHSCWAKFTQTSGTELVRANSDFGQERVRFLIRYTEKELDRKLLVSYRGSYYEIQYIHDYGDDHRYIEIWCVWESRGGRP